MVPRVGFVSFVSLCCVWGRCGCHTHLGPNDLPPTPPCVFPVAWNPSPLPPWSTLLPPRWLVCCVQQAFGVVCHHLEQVCCSVLSFPTPSKKKPHNLIEKEKKPHISVFPPRSRPSHVPSELPASVPPPLWMTNLSGSSINSLCPQGHFTCFSAIGLLLLAFLHPADATLPLVTLVFSQPRPQCFFATTAPWGRGAVHEALEALLRVCLSVSSFWFFNRACSGGEPIF